MKRHGKLPDELQELYDNYEPIKANNAKAIILKRIAYMLNAIADILDKEE